MHRGCAARFFCAVLHATAESARGCRLRLGAVIIAAAGMFVPAVASAGQGFGDTRAAPKCEGAPEVIAVVYNDKRPERSFAMIAGDGGGRMVRIGSRVTGKLVVAILPQAVWLGPERSPCWIPLGYEGPQTVEPPPSNKPKKRKKNKNYKMKDPNYKMKR